MSSHLDRVVIERDELFDKIGKLEFFIGTLTFHELVATDKTLLRAQLSAMQSYHHILNIRLSR